MFGMSRIPPTSSLLPCRGLHDDIFGRLTRERLRRRTICRMMPEGEAETSFLHRGGSVFKFVSPFLSKCRSARGAHHVWCLRPRLLGRWVEFLSEV